MKIEVIEANPGNMELYNRMNPSFVQIPLANRDRYLTSIEHLLREKQRMLIEKRKTLKKVLNQNRFLNEVMSDYETYYQKIMDQKQKQMNALKMLNQYIDGLIQKEMLTAENLKDAKKEQKKILNEVKKIKKDLDKLA